MGHGCALTARVKQVHRDVHAAVLTRSQPDRDASMTASTHLPHDPRNVRRALLPFERGLRQREGVPDSMA